MKKAVIVSCISFAAGVLIYYKISISLFIFLAASLLLAVLVKLIISKGRVRIEPIIILLFFSFGILRFYISDDISIKKESSFLDRYVTIEGRIIDKLISSEASDNYTVRINSIIYDGKRFKLNKKISLVLFKEDKDTDGFSYGDIILASGFLSVPSDGLNSLGFDPLLYNKTKKIFFEIKSDYSKASLIGNELKWWRVSDVSHLMRRFTKNAIDKYIKGDGADLTKAILLGDKSDLSDDILSGLKVGGLSHITAVSGLHISGLLMIVTYLFVMLRVNKRWTDYIALFMLGFIVIYEGASISVIRSVIMSLIYIGARLFNRDNHTPTALAVAALTMLIINPFVLFDVAFQLSIGAVVGIILFSNRISEIFCKYIRLKWISGGLGITTSVSIITAPIIAFYFNIFPLFTLPANLIIVPIIPSILVCSFALTLFSLVSPVAIIFAGYLQMVSGGVAVFLSAIGKLSFSALDVSSPNLIFFIIYALLVYILYELLYKRKNFLMQAAISAVLALTVICIVSSFSYANDISVTFINVGQGDATLISLPGNKNVIIDGGGSYPFSKGNIGESVFVPYLKKRGIKTIDAAILSHFDNDHAQGVIAAVEQLEVKNLILPLRSESENIEAKEKLEDLASEKGIRLHYFSDNSTLVFNNKIIFRALFPAIEDACNLSYNENNRSLVIMLSYNDFNILFTGDIEQEAEEYLQKKGNELNCEILKVAHHGSDTSTSEGFLNYTSPDIAVVSAGNNNPFGHPSDRVLSRIKKSGAFIYRTDENGDIAFLIGKNGIKKITTFK